MRWLEGLHDEMPDNDFVTRELFCREGPSTAFDTAQGVPFHRENIVHLEQVEDGSHAC